MQDELLPALMMGIPWNGHTRPILQLMTIPTIRKQSCLPRPRMKACRSASLVFSDFRDHHSKRVGKTGMPFQRHPEIPILAKHHGLQVPMVFGSLRVAAAR